MGGKCFQFWSLLHGFLIHFALKQGLDKMQGMEMTQKADCLVPVLFCNHSVTRSKVGMIGLDDFQS